MTEQEYSEKLALIEKNYEREKIKLYKEYAMLNARFKIGDMIKDYRYAFVIDKITVSKFNSLPEPVYHGFELKKDLTPRKDKNRVSIYGNNAELITESKLTK